MDQSPVTIRTPLPPAASHSPALVCSIFPGIDLLGRSFELDGYCVVRGPDILWGGDVRDFFPPRGSFTGIIGGPPCQQFSDANRARPTTPDMALLQEFVRVVEAAGPEWFLMENVRSCPDITPRGYTVQRFFLNARECGSRQHRLRRFQFGSLDGVGLMMPPPVTPVRPAEKTCLASEGAKTHRRTWAEFCVLQGLPATFDLPGLPVHMKYRAFGNGVPIEMGRVLAAAVTRRHVTACARVCLCGCGRVPSMYAHAWSVTCRKRLERMRRDRAAFAGDRGVTA